MRIFVAGRLMRKYDTKKEYKIKNKSIFILLSNKERVIFFAVRNKNSVSEFEKKLLEHLLLANANFD